MKQMTPAEYRTFLTQRAHTMKLATVRADGRPHVAPVWFDLDGETILFTTWHASVKAKNMRRDPRVALCIDDATPPFAFVLIEGAATLTEDTEDLIYWATRIGGKYMGADRADAYGERNGVPGELLVRVTPTKIVAQSGITD